MNTPLPDGVSAKGPMRNFRTVKQFLPLWNRWNKTSSFGNTDNMNLLPCQELVHKKAKILQVTVATNLDSLITTT